MSDVIWVAIITGTISLVGTIITVLSANKTQSAKMHEEIAVIKNEVKTLSDRVEKHNSVIERTYKLEAEVKVLKEGKQ